MTNLEFIEELIKNQKETIELMKNMIAESTKYPSIKKLNEENLKCVEEQLAHLQHIKTDLEAWEETKKYLTLNEGFLPFYESTYEYITLNNDCIDESNSEEEGISISKIKKALEVDYDDFKFNR